VEAMRRALEVLEVVEGTGHVTQVLEFVEGLRRVYRRLGMPCSTCARVVQHVVEVAEDIRRPCWRSWRSYSV
jgi:hypothetical protein